MAGKISVNDSAGVFVRLNDKSQRPVERPPKIMSGAFAINSERGIMNQIYYVRDNDEVKTYFGKKDWRKYGKSMYDLSIFLEAKSLANGNGFRPAYVVRVGTGTKDNILAGASFYIDNKDDLSTNLKYGSVVDPTDAKYEGGFWYANSNIKRTDNVDGWNDDTINKRLELCRFYAKGEGEWGNNIRIMISQFKGKEDDGNLKELPAVTDPKTNQETKPKRLNRPKPKFANEDSNIGDDGGRLFNIAVTCPGQEPEYYEYVSFNSKDTGTSGSCFIEKVLAGSTLIGVVVNPDIDPDTNNLYVLPENDERQWTITLQGGKVDPEWLNPKGDYKYDSEKRSRVFKDGLKAILDNWEETDPWLAINAGQEIKNSEFNSLFGDPLKDSKVTDRCVAFSSVLEANSYEVPTDNKDLNTKWVVKAFQWLGHWDEDTKTDILTSPAGWLARTIAVNDLLGKSMEAPAGYVNGVIKTAGSTGATRISMKPKAEERKQAQENQWNPIKYDPTTGYVLWDASTSQEILSSFSSTHVLIAFQMIRRDIEEALRDFVFKKNDDYTIKSIVGQLNNIGSAYKQQGYLEDYNVDTKNNAYGTEQIRINFNVTFKEAARTIVVDFNAYRSDIPLSVQLAD